MSDAAAIVPRRAWRRHCNAATSVTLLHHRTDPPVTNDILRAAAAGIAGKENHGHTADDILQWNVSHRCEDAAVGGVTAIVAEHEKMSGWHGKDIGIVVETASA